MEEAETKLSKAKKVKSKYVAKLNAVKKEMSDLSVRVPFSPVPFFASPPIVLVLRSFHSFVRSWDFFSRLCAPSVVCRLAALLPLCCLCIVCPPRVASPLCSRVLYAVFAPMCVVVWLSLQDEWALQREQMMSTIREQTKENKLLEQLVGMFLPAAEMGKVCPFLSCVLWVFVNAGRQTDCALVVSAHGFTCYASSFFDCASDTSSLTSLLCVS